MIPQVRRLVEALPGKRAALVALTGIDGCGKGYLAARLEGCLRREGFSTSVINVDAWLNLPHIRFSEREPAAHFYDNAIRFDEMFGRLVLPLKQHRSISVEADFATETAHTYTKYHYCLENVDVILLEGIYLLKRRFQTVYDLAVWIDCTFETALERAVVRGQEALSREATTNAYQTIYFPAQMLHSVRDRPREAASLIVINDPRLQFLGVQR